jgi:NAD(P)-dependent dehydrogenase (short-subunit alcohol dehydrogenase family)
LTRALLESLRQSPRPRIVNMSSTVGSMEVAATVGRDVGYVVSKAALNMITVKLAGRLRGDAIIVVALHPGLLRTALGTPRGNLEDPGPAAAEIVALIDGLTPDQSGSFLHRDGTVHPW